MKFSELKPGQVFKLARWPKREWVKIEPVRSENGKFIRFNVRATDGQMSNMGHSASVLLPPYEPIKNPQSRRYERIKAALTAAGWKSQSAMLTAMADGTVDVPENPNREVAQ
jgi:hypothetical protein